MSVSVLHSMCAYVCVCERVYVCVNIDVWERQKFKGEETDLSQQINIVADAAGLLHQPTFMVNTDTKQCHLCLSMLSSAQCSKRIN